MGLYLTVFDEDEEIDGVEVGNYSDFGVFRENVTKHLEGNLAGSRFPVLINHHDSDGEWSLGECEALKQELVLISQEFRQIPASGFSAEWQRELGNRLSLAPQSLYDSFIDVDGEPLIERLIQLCNSAIDHRCPIIFQ